MRYAATYLPQVAAEQGWNHDETLRSLLRKAGYRGNVTRSLLDRVQVTRYQSLKASVAYAQYARLKQLPN